MKTKKKNYALPIIIALVAVIAGVCYIVAKIMRQQLDYEKWKDYEECGLG